MILGSNNTKSSLINIPFVISACAHKTVIITVLSMITMVMVWSIVLFFLQIQYIETSAKQKTNVDAAFHDLVRAIRYGRHAVFC